MCIGPVNKTINMLACWFEDPDGDAFKRCGATRRLPRLLRSCPARSAVNPDRHQVQNPMARPHTVADMALQSEVGYNHSIRAFPGLFPAVS